MNPLVYKYEGKIYQIGTTHIIHTDKTCYVCRILSFIDTQIIDNPWIFQAPHFKDFYCSRNAGCKNALFEFTIQLFWGQRYFYLFSLWDRQHTTQCYEIRKKCAMVKNKNILENFILAFVIFDDDIFVFLLIASFFQY